MRWEHRHKLCGIRAVAGGARESKWLGLEAIGKVVWSGDRKDAVEIIAEEASANIQINVTQENAKDNYSLSCRRLSVETFSCIGLETDQKGHSEIWLDK